VTTVRITKREGGSGLVEFALVLPVLALIFMGIFDFGRAIYSYSAISNGAREGARYGIVHPANRDSDGLPYTGNTIEARAAAQLVALDPAQVSIQVCYPPPAFDEVSYNYSACPDPNPRPRQDPAWGYVAVVVHYDFYPVTPLIGSLWGGGPLPLMARSNMHLE
jgi:hypothetical protein